MKKIVKKVLKEEFEDLSWINETNPASKEYVEQKVRRFVMLRPYAEKIIEVVTNLALREYDVDQLVDVYGKAFNAVIDESYERGLQVGWEEGSNTYSEEIFERGWNEGYDEARFELESGLDEKWEEGYNDGMERGFKEGYEKGKEETYHVAFEEGRQYQSDLEEEEYQKLQDPFTRDLEDDEH